MMERKPKTDDHSSRGRDQDDSKERVSSGYGSYGETLC